MKITEDHFNNLLEQVRRTMSPPRIGWDLTKEQFEELYKVASQNISIWGEEYFKGFIDSWVYSLNFNDSQGNRLLRLHRKGYIVLYLHQRLIVTRKDFAKVYKSITQAHRDIFNY